MTHEEKINYMRIACNLCSYGFNNEQLDVLISLYEMVLEKGDNGTIRDAAKIQAEAKERADIKSRSEMLDKISKKV